MNKYYLIKYQGDWVVDMKTEKQKINLKTTSVVEFARFFSAEDRKKKIIALSMLSDIKPEDLKSYTANVTTVFDNDSDRYAVMFTTEDNKKSFLRHIEPNGVVVTKPDLPVEVGLDHAEYLPKEPAESAMSILDIMKKQDMLHDNIKDAQFSLVKITRKVENIKEI